MTLEALKQMTGTVGDLTVKQWHDLCQHPCDKLIYFPPETPLPEVAAWLQEHRIKAWKDVG